MNNLNIIFLSLALLMSGFLFAQPSPLRFEDPVQKFQKVDEGQGVSLTFIFENSGGEPVVIQEAKVNCSCTKVTFPKAPVKPGEKNNIVVEFDTKGKIGFQERNIELVTSDGTSQITFKGVVKASKETKQRYRKNN